MSKPASLSSYDAPEWLRDLRGWPAFMICVHIPWPAWCVNSRLYLWLLPYAGDWACRDERRQLRASLR